MKISSITLMQFINNNKRTFSKVGLGILLIIFTFIWSCNRPKESNKLDFMNSNPETSLMVSPVSFSYSGNLVEVKTKHMEFIMPDEIPSGWNTFRYYNESNLTHFMSLDKMPVVDGEQKTIKDFMQVAPIYQDAMDLINEGKAEEGYAEFAKFPAWSSQIVFSGGVGLVSPGETAQTTVHLEPGVYVAECYVKTDGKFHPMAKQFTVTNKTANSSPPEPTLSIIISKEGGIEVDDKEINPGNHTIEVHFKDQSVHENYLGHDVNLVKLEEDTDLAVLDSWMNWAAPQGLETPAPATFLGGAQQMPGGNTAYFTVNLEPGRYAWVSEVPAPSTKNMLKTFTVPFEQQTAK